LAVVGHRDPQQRLRVAYSLHEFAELANEVAVLWDIVATVDICGIVRMAP